MAPAIFPKQILTAYGAPFEVNTLTTLGTCDVDAFTEILVTLANPDLTNTVTLIVDPGDPVLGYDVNQRFQDYADPQATAQVRISGSLYPSIRISAQTAAPGYPTVNGVTYQVLVQRLPVLQGKYR